MQKSKFIFKQFFLYFALEQAIQENITSIMLSYPSKTPPNTQFIPEYNIEKTLFI